MAFFNGLPIQKNLQPAVTLEDYQVLLTHGGQHTWEPYGLIFNHQHRWKYIVTPQKLFQCYLEEMFKEKSVCQMSEHLTDRIIPDMIKKGSVPFTLESYQQDSPGGFVPAVVVLCGLLVPPVSNILKELHKITLATLSGMLCIKMKSTTTLTVQISTAFACLIPIQDA